MEPQHRRYKGHRIELRAREQDEFGGPEAERGEKLELLIDGEPVRYGQLPDGSYALLDYAFDWRNDLVDLAQRYIDYQAKAGEIRREPQSGEED